MSKRVQLAFALATAAAAGAALLMSACESVPLTAPPGTTMTMDANPAFVIANGGVSVVTAILVEPAGTFVPDGTEVFFFTNLGRVDASGKTRNGVVRVNFVSDSRSGTATVSGVSGGPAPAPPTTPTTTVAPVGRAGVTASAGRAPAGALDVSATTGENNAFVEILVGNALADHVVVTANPQVLSTARSSTIVANVFDVNGNTVQNVPVIFSAESSSGDPNTPAPPLTEFLESGGAPRFTDANGQAFDTLRTRAPAPGAAGLSKTVVVKATPAKGESGTVTVTIFYSTGR